MIVCRACGISKPEDCFYVAGLYVDKICRPCKKQRTAARKQEINHRPGRRTVACQNCGVTFESDRKVALHCSRICKDEFRKSQAKADRLLAKTVRSCQHCGQDMKRSARTDARFCSEHCNSAAHQWWRKAAERTGASRFATRLIARADIGARDLWMCGLCHEQVDRSLQYPDPGCASIDHVLPVSHGGSHDMTNLQLTHLLCNVRKRDVA